MAEDAKTLLSAEVNDNLKNAKLIRGALSHNVQILSQFSVGAWGVVSKGNMLSGLDPAETGKLLAAYKSIYEGNEYISKIENYRAAANFALPEASPLFKYYQQALQATLDQIDLKLQATTLGATDTRRDHG